MSAVPKGVYPHTHIKPREYPVEVVELVRRMYLVDGMTVAEVQRELPAGFKAQRIIERHIPERRPAVKRNQAGAANDSWKGDAAGYAALHLRVATNRGKPSLCERCGTTEGRFEWANLSGNYQDTNDYARMCVTCHRRFDAARRATTGRRTMPTGR